MGYASRLAALAGVDLWTLVHDMRISMRELSRGDAKAFRDLSDIRGLGGSEREALALYTPIRNRGPSGYTLAGHRLPPQSVLTISTKVCPHCVAEDVDAFDGRVEARPWQRVAWILDTVGSCARHGTMLVEVSPSEAIHIGIDFSKTVAERVLPNLDRLRKEAAPAPGSAYGDWIVARLDGTLDPRNWLDDAPLHAGIIFCEALGISILHPPMTRPRSLTPVEMCRAIHEGFTVASQGAEAVTAALNAMTDARFLRTRGSPGQEKIYGHVYHALDRVGGDPDFTQYRDFLREHAFDTLPFPTGRKILGVKLKERRVHTLATAARAYSHANVIMRRMLSTRKADAARGGLGGAARPVVPIHELDALAEKMGDHLNRTGVASATGFTIDQVDLLVNEGWLPTLAEGQRRADVRQRYRRSDVEALMERFFRNAESVAGPEGRRMTVTKARIATRTLNTEILGLIHDGKLAWVGRHGDGRRYENLLVDADEARAILRPPAPSQGVTAIEAVALLPGVQKSSVAHLARAGLLTFIREFRPDCLRTVRLYSLTSVDAFRKEYVTAGEIGKATGWPPLQVVRHLAKAGVPEVVDYAKVQTKVYRRGDVVRHVDLNGTPATAPPP